MVRMGVERTAALRCLRTREPAFEEHYRQNHAESTEILVGMHRQPVLDRENLVSESQLLVIKILLPIIPSVSALNRLVRSLRPFPGAHPVYGR